MVFAQRVTAFNLSRTHTSIPSAACHWSIVNTRVFRINNPILWYLLFYSNKQYIWKVISVAGLNKTILSLKRNGVQYSSCVKNKNSATNYN